MSALVNGPQYVFWPDILTFKFFVTGHTYMSADSFHAAIQKIYAKKRIFSLDEFGQVVGSTKQHSAVIKPLWSDFKALSSSTAIMNHNIG